MDPLEVPDEVVSILADLPPGVPVLSEEQSTALAAFARERALRSARGRLEAMATRAVRPGHRAGAAPAVASQEATVKSPVRSSPVPPRWPTSPPQIGVEPTEMPWFWGQEPFGGIPRCSMQLFQPPFLLGYEFNGYPSLENRDLSHGIATRTEWALREEGALSVGAAIGRTDFGTFDPPQEGLPTPSPYMILNPSPLLTLKAHVATASFQRLMRFEPTPLFPEPFELEVGARFMLGAGTPQVPWPISTFPAMSDPGRLVGADVWAAIHIFTYPSLTQVRRDSPMYIVHVDGALDQDVERIEDIRPTTIEYINRPDISEVRQASLPRGDRIGLVSVSVTATAWREERIADPAMDSGTVVSLVRQEVDWPGWSRIPINVRSWWFRLCSSWPSP